MSNQSQQCHQDTSQHVIIDWDLLEATKVSVVELNIHLATRPDCIAYVMDDLLLAEVRKGLELVKDTYRNVENLLSTVEVFKKHQTNSTMQST